MDSLRDHLRVKEIESHHLEVTEIKRNAKHWRLQDCSIETLERMRFALIEEMDKLEKELSAEDQQFLFYIQEARPIETEQSRETIERLSTEWEDLRAHLKDVDHAILELHLRQRLVKLFTYRGYIVLEGLVFASILVILVLTIMELLAPLPEETIVLFLQIDTVVSFFLLGDFFLRLFLSEDRRWYFRRYWVDFVSSLPLTVLHFGRLVRIARFARLLRLLRLGRAMRVLMFAFRGLDKLSQTFQLNLLKRSLIIAGALLAFGALTISLVEGPNHEGLQTMSDSFWWSFTTVVTGGFADLYNPETNSGRLVTVGLVLLGLVVTGIFTASLTSVLVEDDSDRITQNQRTLEMEMGVLNQKLDLLSGETNRGLIALEVIAQELANQRNVVDLGHVLVGAMMEHFQCLQASVHILSPTQRTLETVVQVGDERAFLDEEIVVGRGLAGRTAALLLEEDDPASLDIEPITEPSFDVAGVRMVCPLVGGRELIGLLHVILPEEFGRFYLYNRAPQTLAHHAATAVHALMLEAELRAAKQ